MMMAPAPAHDATFASGRAVIELFMLDGTEIDGSIVAALNRDEVDVIVLRDADVFFRWRQRVTLPAAQVSRAVAWRVTTAEVYFLEHAPDSKEFHADLTREIADVTAATPTLQTQLDGFDTEIEELRISLTRQQSASKSATAVRKFYYYFLLLLWVLIKTKCSRRGLRASLTLF